MSQQRCAHIFLSLIDYFLCLLRPVEVAAVMILSRASRSRDWDRLLALYLRCHFRADLLQLFGESWLRTWSVPVREKLGQVLRRRCICGEKTDQFSPTQHSRLCRECAASTRTRTKSLTTTLFYDEDVHVEVTEWTRDPIAAISSVPVGGRVQVIGDISTAYGMIMIHRAIWISGLNPERSLLSTGGFTMAVMAPLRLTDLTVVNGHRRKVLAQPKPEDAMPAIQIMNTGPAVVCIERCVIMARAGAGVLALRGHAQLRRNVFKECAHAAITTDGGTVDAVGNRFERLRSWCFQEKKPTLQTEDFVTSFKACNDIRSAAPHFYVTSEIYVTSEHESHVF